MNKKVLLVTIGSDGDVRPFIALARELIAHGAEPLIASSARHAEKVLSAGIAFKAVGPGIAEYERDLGLSLAEIQTRLGSDPGFFMRSLVLPYLPRHFEDIDALAQDAALMLTHTGAHAARLVAEKRQIPHFTIALHPGIFFSTYDPPILAEAPKMSRFTRACGRWATQKYLDAIKQALLPQAAPIFEMRKRLGLAERNAHPFFEGLFLDGALALYSPLLGGPQPDHPPNTHIVGFPFFDAQGAQAPALAPELETFLAADSVPLVFTLGTAGSADAARFLRSSYEATLRLKRRAVFVLDPHQLAGWTLPPSSEVFVCGYAPYSLLFPRAEVIVHHGGIGTLAQALRAGKPQLILPTTFDQPDNAARAVRLGVATSLRMQQYSPEVATVRLKGLGAHSSYAEKASLVGADVASESFSNAVLRRVTAR